MSDEQGYYNQPYGARGQAYPDRDGYESEEEREHRADNAGRYRDEVYSKRVPAGKRTYFFDVKTTRSGEDFFVTITESKRVGEGRYEKHKIFLYKEDFGKFIAAMHEVVQHIQAECLPDYDFHDVPDLPPAPDGGDVEPTYSSDDRDF